MYKYSFTRVSGNTKTGPIPTTMTNRASCPSACPLAGSGCYADLGPTGMHWSRVDTNPNALSIEGLAGAVKGLPKGQLWRHNVAGDLPHVNQMVGGLDLLMIVVANKGKRGFTYTHHRVAGQDDTAAHNRACIAAANAAGFTVNLSANNAEHADELQALNIGPVVVVMPEDCAKVTRTAAGNTIVQCPATYSDTVTCASCGICAVSSRKAIIGFPVHGARKRKASEIIRVYKSGDAFKG